MDNSISSPTPKLFPNGASSGNSIFWERLEADLPPVFARARVSELCGGIIAPGTLANLDSQGKGPAVRVKVGKHIGYERASFVRWLKERTAM